MDAAGSCAYDVSFEAEGGTYRGLFSSLDEACERMSACPELLAALGPDTPPVSVVSWDGWGIEVWVPGRGAVGCRVERLPLEG